MKKKDDEDHSVNLTENVLEGSCHDRYEHDVFDVQTDEEKVKERIEIITRKENERLAQMEALERQKQQEEEDSNANNSQKGDELEEVLEEEDDEIEYEVFYDTPDIRHTLNMQKRNVFQDIFQHRTVLLSGEKNGKQALKARNKFNIEDWAPKNQTESGIESPRTNRNQKKKGPLIMSFDNTNEKDGS